MPDEPQPPTDGDAVDEAATSEQAAAGPTREALDIPEWVSEVRRLYVEPKTRAQLREEGEPSRYRRLPGIRPSRRAATAAPDPAARSTTEGHPLAAPAEPEPLSLARLAAPMVGPVPPPLTPAWPPSPAPGTPGTTETTETTESAVVTEPTADAPSAGAASNGSGGSSLSERWVPPTWTSPASSSGPDRVTGTSDAQPDPAPRVEEAETAVDPDPVSGPAVEPPDAEVLEPVEPEPVEPEPIEPEPVGPVEHVEPVETVDAAPRDARPGRPSTVPAVHLSWREADSLHLGVPSVDDSFDAIVLEPPSQLVADTRRRSQRRRSDEVEGAAEAAAISAPLAAVEDAESLSGAKEDPSSSGAVDGDAGVRRARLSRALAVAGAVLVLLVLVWLVLRTTGSDSAAPAPRPGVLASAQGQEGELSAHEQRPRVEVGTCPSCSQVQARHGPAV